MRKFIGLAVVAALLASLAAAPAGATTLPLGVALNGNLKDFSSVWDTSNGGDGNPLDVGEAIQLGDEQRAIFTVSSLFFGALGPGDPTGTDFITAGGPVGTYSNSSLTGLLYDVDYRAAVVESTGLTTYWTAGTRYTKGVDWVDTYTRGFPAVHTLAGYGGIVVIYADDTVDWNPATSGGDSAWSAGTGPALGAALPTMSDEYPTVADIPGASAIPVGDASPFLILALTPIPSIIQTLDAARFSGLTASDVFIEEKFTSATPDPGGITGGATGFAFANVLGGAFAPFMATNVFGPGLDVRFDFDVKFVTQKLQANGWLGESEDPVGFATIPEPTTVSLLVVGLLGLVGLRKRDQA